jgi:lactate dehydrogenase-like 2-hydroxyacid dehydrogenase
MEKKVRIIGTGKIRCFAKIMHGFGCSIMPYDPTEVKIEKNKYL